jgi:hypothetical protein
MTNAQKLDTHHKALTLNLDPFTFGSFAEIGAGQEVARWFLVVGAPSGTVAKTIAYDNEVGDDLDGSGSRYQGLQTRFFSFADTVTARNNTGRTMLMAGPVEKNRVSNANQPPQKKSRMSSGGSCAEAA